MSDDFYAGGELSQAARGVHPRDLADGDANPEDGKPPECQRADCSGLRCDGFAGCCSTACTIENADDSAADVPNAQRDTEDSELTPGTRIQCDEARAESPQHDYGESGIDEQHPRFTALVDSVQGEYVEATVTRRNPHTRSPDPGAHLALSATSIREEARWRVDAEGGERQ